MCYKVQYGPSNVEVVGWEKEVFCRPRDGGPSKMWMGERRDANYRAVFQNRVHERDVELESMAEEKWVSVTLL